MTFQEQDLELAKRHVNEGEEHIARVEQLISQRRISGLPIEQSEGLLAEMLETLAGHRTHLELIRKELATPSSLTGL